MRKLGFLWILMVMATPLWAQQKWSLRQCVEYAITNNINVQQSQVQERLNKLIWQQSRDARIPTANAQGSGGGQFGRSIDPTTNQFTTNNISFTNVSIQSGVTLFNWFSQKYTVASNKLTYEASLSQTKKLQDDIALNVAAAYLQALLAYEQKESSGLQARQTAEQLRITRLRVDAGALPELNAAELDAQLARDSAAIITAESTFRLNLLQLKALLNIDAGTPFDIETPSIEAIPVLPLADLDPERVYQSAVGIRPILAANQQRYEAAQKAAAAAKARLYPTISAFGNLQTAYSSALRAVPKGANYITVVPTLSYVTVANTDYQVYSPVSRPESFEQATFFRQFGYNFRQSLGLSLQVPIFNGHQARTNWKRALENQENVKLQMKADSLTLKQDIYTAYQNAVNALATWNARIKTYRTAEYSYSLGRQRYEVGLLPVLELVTLQTNVQRALIDQLIARYDYVFRTKILEFYQGNAVGL